MNRCKTCKWWGVKWEPLVGDRELLSSSMIDPESCHRDIIDPLDPDTYGSMDMPFKVKMCGCPKLFFHERPVESTGACVADGSTYMANLLTAEDFGCVNHEAKP